MRLKGFQVLIRRRITESRGWEGGLAPALFFRLTEDPFHNGVTCFERFA